MGYPPPQILNIKLTFLLELHMCDVLLPRLQLLLPALLREWLRPGLDHGEGREREQIRWLNGLLLRAEAPRRAAFHAAGEAVAVLVAADVQDVFVISAEVVQFGGLLELMRALGSQLSVLVVMELRLLLEPLPLVRGRRQVPFLLLLFFYELLKAVPHSLFFYFCAEKVDLSCHLCTYSIFKGLGCLTAHVRKNCSPLPVNFARL